MSYITRHGTALCLSPFVAWPNCWAVHYKTGSQAHQVCDYNKRCFGKHHGFGATEVQMGTFSKMWWLQPRAIGIVDREEGSFISTRSVTQYVRMPCSLSLKRAGICLRQRLSTFGCHAFAKPINLSVICLVSLLRRHQVQKYSDLLLMGSKQRKFRSSQFHIIAGSATVSKKSWLSWTTVISTKEGKFHCLIYRWRC